MPRRWRLPGVLAALILTRAGDVLAQPSCPATGAAVSVLVENLSADASVAMTVSGELVDETATCAGAGQTVYSMPLTCVGSGLALCGTVSGLRPGAWVNHLSATVTGTSQQIQHRRDVFVAGGMVPNVLVWTIYPRTEVVEAATEDALRTALAAASPGPALVTFSSAFRGHDAPQTIDLTAGTCPPDRPAALCITDSGIVVDALDAQARSGGVRLSVGQQELSVLQVFGSDDVFRGLVFDGSQAPSPTDQMANQTDTVAFTGLGARRNRIEQSMVNGPTRGDAVSGDTSAGGEGDDANVVDGCELSGAQDRGLKVTTGAHVTISRSCLHANQNGGVSATLGGHVLAVENVIQHNVPGMSQNGITVRGVSPCLSIPSYANCDEPSTAETSGNIVRFHGGRGLTVTDNATASFTDDYVADNEIIGSKVETTHHPVASGESSGKMPVATFRGVALVCNRNAAVSNTCQPQAGSDEAPCGTDADCCGLTSGCCVNDAGCMAPLHCLPVPSVQGFGASQAQATGEPVPVVDYGTAAEPGQNAFAWNVGALPGGINFNVNVASLFVTAQGNQWEHCGPKPMCDTMMVGASDVRLTSGATIALGAPPNPRAGAPALAAVSPVRPQKNDLVRVFGDNFDAIDGTACAAEAAPANPCSAENEAVRDQSRLMDVNSITILDANGDVLASAWPDAVTPTMLAFQMPFDCFAPLTLRVTKLDPGGVLMSGMIALCEPPACAGQPAGHPCDDGNPCTTGDRCDGAGVCRPGELVVCTGRCLTGECDASGRCVPKPADASCDDGDPCTVGDHCAGDGDVCVAGSAACDDGDPCTTGDVCSGGVCRGLPVRGFEGAICRVGTRLGEPICTADGNVRFERFASNRLRKVNTLLQRAADTAKLTRRDRLVRRSAATLKDIASLAARYRRDGRISRPCASAVKHAIGEIRRLVMALIV